jgi:hypothetical protein
MRARGVHIPDSPRSIAEEHVVGMFLVHILSLTATVMPLRDPLVALHASSGTTCTSAFMLAFLS